MAEQNALISVYDKTGIVEFAEGLHELDWSIYASGGTARKIDEAGVPVTDVAELVGGDAILDHRVVTLSREIHAGLLAQNTPEHLAELEEQGISWLDLVCIDMYPLEEAIATPGATEQDIIEKTDVGGPTMLHSAAKGRRIVLSRADQRAPVLDWLREGRPSEQTMRRLLAAVAEREVGRYVAQSGKYLGQLALASGSASSHEAIIRRDGLGSRVV